MGVIRFNSIDKLMRRAEAMQALVACLLAHSLHQAACEQLYRQQVNNINFISLRTIKEVRDGVKHVAVDEFIEKHILYSSTSAIFTQSIDPKSSKWVIGRVSHNSSIKYKEGNKSEALFGVITSFVHMSRSLLLVVDQDNNVLRVVDRLTESAYLLAGSINEKSAKDGSLSTCSFHHPAAIVKLNHRKYFISQPLADAIAMLDFSGKEAQVVHIRSTISSPRGISLDASKQSLFVANSNQVFRFYLQNYSTFPLNKKTEGELYRDGLLKTSSYNLLSDIVVLNQDTLLTMDKCNQRLRVIDLHGNVSSVCTGLLSPDQICVSPTVAVDGDIRRCVMNGLPNSGVVFNESAVVIATSQAILLLTTSDDLQPYPTVTSSEFKVDGEATNSIDSWRTFLELPKKSMRAIRSTKRDQKALQHILTNHTNLKKNLSHHSSFVRALSTDEKPGDNSTEQYGGTSRAELGLLILLVVMVAAVVFALLTCILFAIRTRYEVMTFKRVEREEKSVQDLLMKTIAVEQRMKQLTSLSKKRYTELRKTETRIKEVEMMYIRPEGEEVSQSEDEVEPMVAIESASERNTH